jgi:hypothetical protein
MSEAIEVLLALFRANNGINDKAQLAKLVCERCNLTRDRSVFYCDEFAVRFSASVARSFGNTVLSLSNLRKYDDRPFIVCLVTPSENYCLLANTTFLKKISHSSQQLRENNIRGSFNGSDIGREFESIPNEPGNFARLFEIHAAIGFEGNLARLVEATNNISPTGHKFAVDDATKEIILSAPKRAGAFAKSDDSAALKRDLDSKVDKFKSEILLAALIENVNVRGRVIEYLIAGEDERLRQEIIAALKLGKRGLPQFKTENSLGDYTRSFPSFDTETDVKTKVMILASNPKAYNLDKMLEFLSKDRSVFMFYFVGVEPGRIVNTVLVSMFQTRLLDATILLKHWSGRNSRGVTQFEGRAINHLIENPQHDMDERQAKAFLEQVIAL